MEEIKAINREKDSYKKRLKKENGSLLNDSDDILNEIKSFYEKLYTSSLEDETIPNILGYLGNTLNLNSLSKREKAVCGGDNST